MNSARFTFRAKLLAIVGIAAAAFVGLVVTGALLGNRVAERMTTIQEKYLPMVELEPELQGELDKIRHGFQDAVASRDVDELATVAVARTRFVARLDAASGALDRSAADALRRDLDDYLTSASDVSRRLIAGETGEGMVDAVAAMQSKQALVTRQLETATALDRRALAEAFGASTRAVKSAETLQLWIGVACLSVVLVLSLGLSRSVLAAVTALAAGLQRFGTGDFTEPIPITTSDELGRVAERANRMAASLDRMGRERERADLALKASNRELETFSYSVAHDLRAPLRGINGFSRALLEDHGDALAGEAKDYLQRIASAALRMGELIDALLALARVSRTEVRKETVNLGALAASIVNQLKATHPDRDVTFVNDVTVPAQGDPTLLRAVLENLIGNAWKFTSARPSARITFGVNGGGKTPAFYVRDDGAGFDMAHSEKLFAPFQRLHSVKDFAGTGIGLATVERIIHRHGGSIWAEGAIDRGATFHFTLPAEGAHS